MVNIKNRERQMIEGEIAAGPDHGHILRRMLVIA